MTAMSVAGQGAQFDLIRLSTLLFLVDQEIPDLVGGPHFNFTEGGYGPCDPALLGELEGLCERQLASLDCTDPYPLYSLTRRGLAQGQSILKGAGEEVASYLDQTASWVFLADHNSLYASLYEAFPEMAARSKVRLAEYRPPTILSPSEAFVRGFTHAFDPTAELDDGIWTWIDPATYAQAAHWGWKVAGDGLREAMEAHGRSLEEA